MEEKLTEEDVIRYLEECNESQDIIGFCYIPEMVCSRILALYQKEKEKNKKLEKINFRVNNNLLELAEKIENKIMELEEDLRENNYADKTTNAIKYAIKVLQELLEERN